MKRILAILALAACAPAFGHGKLAASQPAAGAVLAKAPKELRLSFNERLEAPFSKVKLTGTQPVALPKATVDKADPKTMTVALPPLASGKYHVEWSAVTSDGHKTKGAYDFIVK